MRSAGRSFVWRPSVCTYPPDSEAPSLGTLIRGLRGERALETARRGRMSRPSRSDRLLVFPRRRDASLRYAALSSRVLFFIQKYIRRIFQYGAFLSFYFDGPADKQKKTPANRVITTVGHSGKLTVTATNHSVRNAIEHRRTFGAHSQSVRRRVAPPAGGACPRKPWQRTTEKGAPA